MYLLYLDESGNPDEPADAHFVIGGIAVFERQTFFLSQEVDRLQEKHFPGRPPIEFHASHIRNGKGFWRNVEPDIRKLILQDLAQVIVKANNPGVTLFSAVVEKDASLYGEDAVKSATEQVCKRFDTFLTRRANEHNDRQRGLLVFAESHYQQRAKIWVRGFRDLGTQWGVLKNLSDIPYFASTRESRLLQLADYISHSMFLLYERNDPSLAMSILPRIDQKDGKLHGLVHISKNKGSACNCPTCSSRRTAYKFAVDAEAMQE
jgi:hypothetical protein